MNKRGELILRDVLFMMVIVSGIFVFAGLFVSDMASNYDNDNMSAEYLGGKTNVLGNSTFYDTSEEAAGVGSDLASETGGILELIGGRLRGIGDVFLMIILAPNTIAELVSGTLIDMNIDTSVAIVIKYLIATVLWGIVIFTIASSVLNGGRI